MSTTVRLSMMGGLGNRCFQFAHAKAFCEQNGHELRCEPWVGEQIFTLDGWTPKRPDSTEQIQLFGYFQSQADLIYSRADCRRWFKFRPEILDHLHGLPHTSSVRCHLRRGDYKGAGYPVLTDLAAINAVRAHGIDCDVPLIISDDCPTQLHSLPAGLEMMSDFWLLMTAPILFRANSSFSYWAAVLSHGRVFSPVITGLAGGVEHDNVPYVEGNWPRLAELSFVTDLHLRES